MNMDNPYVLFSVTRESRIQRIRKLALEEPLWAFLMAVFDFEWTIRRSIVALSPCPTRVVYAYFKRVKQSGFRKYCEAWTKCVRSQCQESIPEMMELLRMGAEKSGLPDTYFDTLQQTLDVRSRLIHGVEGRARKEIIDEGLEMVLRASSILCDYVQEQTGRSVFERISRQVSLCGKCPRKNRGCKFCRERETLKNQKTLS